MATVKYNWKRRFLAIIVFLLVTLGVPFFLFAINIILTIIGSFLADHLGSTMNIVGFFFDGSFIAENILNPLVTAMILYLLIVVAEKICPSREGLRYFFGIIISAVMTVLEFFFFTHVTLNEVLADIAYQVIISQIIYTGYMIFYFRVSGSLSMLVRRKYVVVFMGGNEKENLIGFAAAKCGRSIIGKSGKLDEERLDRMYRSVNGMFDGYDKMAYKYAYPCRIEHIKALYHCYIELGDSSGNNVRKRVVMLDAGKEESIPMDIVNMLKQVKA